MVNINSSGFKKYNGIKCAVAEFKIKNEYADAIVELWIDANKGTLLKSVNQNYDISGDEFLFINEYKTSYDAVTDDDVRKPDLSDYTLMEYNEENNAENYDSNKGLEIKLNDYDVETNGNLIILKNDFISNN